MHIFYNHFATLSRSWPINLKIILDAILNVKVANTDGFSVGSSKTFETILSGPEVQTDSWDMKEYCLNNCCMSLHLVLEKLLAQVSLKVSVGQIGKLSTNYVNKHRLGS